MNSVGVVIGRKQTPYLHEGHLKILNIANKHSHLVVFLGIASVRPTEDNALDFETRKLMIQGSFPNAIVLPLFDIKSSNEAWSKQIDSIILSLFPYIKEVILYCGRDGFKKDYMGTLKVVEIESLPNISATALRNEIKPIDSIDFRKGVIYGIREQFPRIYSCVDILIYKRLKDDIRFIGGSKRHSNKIFLPGGFIDINDTDIYDAGLRETFEETGIKIDRDYFIENSKIITQRAIDSSRNTKDAILWTTLLAYECKDFDDLNPVGGDDLLTADKFLYSRVNKYLHSAHKTLIEIFYC